MSIVLKRCWKPAVKMAEEINSPSAAAAAAATVAASEKKKRSLWPSVLRWIPTSTDRIIESEKRLLSLVKTPYTQERVNIGSGPPGSKIRWFRSASNEPRFINTVSFDSKEGSPTLVMVHGYGASQGFFFRNFDYLAKHFRVIAIDQLGWGGSSRPDFTCKSTEETEAWFIDSFEEWRKAKNLTNFILLGHSFGGYVAAKYALQHPEHVQHLILVGSVGFTSETEHRSEWLTQFRATWKGAIINHLWESNFTPQKLIRGLGPWGPDLVRKYTGSRFSSAGDGLTNEESTLLADYMYHTLAAKASGELCLKYIFSFGAFARSPLLHSFFWLPMVAWFGLLLFPPPWGCDVLVHNDQSGASSLRLVHEIRLASVFVRPGASEWKVPTTFIYGVQDWVNYEGAVEARKNMKVPCEIIRVPQSGHFVFIENAPDFHSAVDYACRRFLSSDQDNQSLPDALLFV